MSSSTDIISLQDLYRELISGSHILHYHEVLDAYGHLSVRHPHKPDVFIMSRSVAPGTISSPADLIEYYVSTAEPVEPNSAKGYAERCIHSECYKRFPSVQSVVHSHSEAVVPYSITGVPLRPCYHMAGFLSAKVPVFEIEKAYEEGDKRDMLVSSVRLGNALAAEFSELDSEDAPSHPVVLMRGHGFTAVGEGIREAVFRAIFTQANARIQTAALTTVAAHTGHTSGIKYLLQEELADTIEMTRWSVSRPWDLWVKEVEAVEFYINKA